MKKQFITVLSISVCALCVFFTTSCDKDDNDNMKSHCFCKAKDSYGNTDSDVVYLEEWGARNCKELTRMLAQNTPGVTFSCS